MSFIRLINKQNLLRINPKLIIQAINKSNYSALPNKYQLKILVDFRSKFNSLRHQSQPVAGDLPSSCQSVPVAKFSTMHSDQDVAGGEPGTSKKVSPVPGKMANGLVNERSPYLLQHAYNPVDWHPWCDETHEKAIALNKPVFLSIGYSTCHWCHVMERESFECEETAKSLNEHYICIKVDREERPDVDKIYMSYVQRTTGSGGWPLSIFLTPKLEPLFGGTYFPPEGPHVKVGFKGLAEAIAKQWRERHKTLNEAASSAMSLLKVAVQQRLSFGTSLASKNTWMKCFHQLSKTYEAEYGGFTESPKFPQPCIFNFLFAMHYKYSNELHGTESLEMCLYTLRKMAMGGIHDHVGSGFARYSVDKKWHVPHFEKMLYDQGQIASSFVDAFVISRDEFYADVVHDVLKYVSRDLSHVLGGFYGAEDADSYPTSLATAKKEGAFYAWTYDEVKALIIDTNDFEMFCFYMSVGPKGNVPRNTDPHGELVDKNVLVCFVTYEETAEKFNVTISEVKETIEKCLNILYEARKLRPRPDVDTKILTAWNGLMISAYAKAGFALKNSDYVERAILAAEFVKKHLVSEDGTLLRCCYTDTDKIVHLRLPIGGFLDDYAFFIRALIDLYEATLDCSWLEWAEGLQNMQNGLFWDDKFKAYYVSSADSDRYIMYRDKEDQDGAEPAANSVSAQNLIRLAAYLDRKDFHELASETISAYTERLNSIPYALPEMSAALMLYYSSPTQIFIAGDRDEEGTQDLLDVVRKSFVPGRLLAILDGPEGKAKLFYDRHPSVKFLKPVKGRPTVYVCKNFACALPITDPTELAINLKGDGLKDDSTDASDSTE